MVILMSYSSVIGYMLFMVMMIPILMLMMTMIFLLLCCNIVISIHVSDGNDDADTDE